MKIMIEGIKYRVKAFISLCGNIVSPKVKILTLEETLNYREQHWFSKCRNLIFLGLKKVLQTVWGGDLDIGLLDIFGYLKGMDSKVAGFGYV